VRNAGASAGWWLAVGLLVLAAFGGAARAADPPFPPPLSSVQVPEPPNLAEFVRDRAAAVALGKALFWDMQVGSDDLTACASCHFHAGADPRSHDQVSPGLLGVDSGGAPRPDRAFDLGPRRALRPADFPLRVLADPLDRASEALRDTNDVVSSKGVAFALFGRDRFGREQAIPAPDPDGFRIARTNLRRVEPRHTPTVVNAVFNHRNFWDGRAQAEFNGVNAFGDRDPDARVFRSAPDGSLAPVRVRIENASLASQALSPPLSSFEMSADGRAFADLGRRLAGAARDGRRPLARQRVHPRDSVLGAWSRHPSPGLRIDSYARWIQLAFQPDWWRSSLLVQVTPDGEARLVRAPDGDSATIEYTLLEWNFGLFFGLSIQLYEATLVADDTPFDRWLAGDAAALSEAAVRGAELFRSQTRGRCINCHAGPELTDASVASVTASPVRIREGQALDRGFNNIGVRPTLEDLGRGGTDPFGGRLAEVVLREPPPAEPIAVDGAFKVPGLRNVELTAPYFHNGGVRTLEEVVAFYSRGGDFAPLLALDGLRIAPLHVLDLTDQEQRDLVAFLRALTDERVRNAAAPFDHPELLVPDGVRAITRRGVVERWLEIPAVGRVGGEPRPGFLE
jgi:cytochrome c peroxidase